MPPLVRTRELSAQQQWQLAVLVAVMGVLMVGGVAGELAYYGLSALRFTRVESPWFLAFMAAMMGFAALSGGHRGASIGLGLVAMIDLLQMVFGLTQHDMLVWTSSPILSFVVGMVLIALGMQLNSGWKPWVLVLTLFVAFVPFRYWTIAHMHDVWRGSSERAALIRACRRAGGHWNAATGECER
jgi:hypothetical protein